MRLLAIIGFFLSSLSLSAQPPEVLSAQKINKLLPTKLQGYSLKGVSRSSQMKVGTLTYALCERNFVSGKKHLRILLFDYVDAPIMFQQAMRNQANAKPIESDSLIYRPVDLVGATGWESANTKAHESKLILGLYDRYFLTISGTELPLSEVTKVFSQIDLKKFPK